MVRRGLIVLWAGVLFLAFAIDAGLAASRRIHPEGGAEEIRLRIGKSESLYHVATRERPLEIRVKGPETIEILSRLLFDTDPAESHVPYQIQLEIDGVEIGSLESVCVVSTKGRTLEGEPVGSLERVKVPIPAGTHRALLYPSEEGSRVALRIFRARERASVKYLPFAPESYDSSVLLHSGDSEVTYYRFTAETPVAFSVNGPVRMKGLTRLDFDHERGYSIAYAVQVSLDGELLQTTRETSTASATSVYPDRPEITPGVGKDIMIEIPAGHHEVSIALCCTTARGAAIRLLIPKKAVTNGS